MADEAQARTDNGDREHRLAPAAATRCVRRTGNLSWIVAGCATAERRPLSSAPRDRETVVPSQSTLLSRSVSAVAPPAVTTSRGVPAAPIEMGNPGLAIHPARGRIFSVPTCRCAAG